MKTLQECKDEIASNYGCKDWNDFQMSAEDDLEYNKAFDEAALLYAQSACEALREKIAKEAKVKVVTAYSQSREIKTNVFESNSVHGSGIATTTTIDRESILSTPIELK